MNLMRNVWPIVGVIITLCGVVAIALIIDQVVLRWQVKRYLPMLEQDVEDLTREEP